MNRSLYQFAAFLFAMSQATSVPLLAQSAPLHIQPLHPADTLEGAVAGSEVDLCGRACFAWMPARNATDAADMWSSGERFRTLSFISIGGTRDSGAAFVDIVSDFAGPIRVSLSGTVAAASEDESQETDDVRRFLAGGGTAVLSAALAGPTLMWGDRSYLMALALPKAGFDFPALGARTDDNTGNLDLGGEVRLYYLLANGQIGIYGQVRAAHVIGGDKFMRDLGLTVTDAGRDVPLDSFSYWRSSLGISIPALNVAVLWTKVLGGTDAFVDTSDAGEIALVIFR